MTEESRLRKNLKQKIRYYNAKGYNIPTSIVNDLDYNQLLEITTQDILDIGNEIASKHGFSEETYEEFLSHEEMIIESFRDSVLKYNDAAQELINRWLNNLIALKGEEAVSSMLEDARSNGLSIESKAVYGNYLEQLFLEFMEYLPAEYAMGTMEIDMIMESLEMMEDWGQY